MAERTGYKDRIKEITDSIEKGITELYESEKYRKYLKTMGRFHKYSFNNTMLIYMQKPDATYVAGYDKWKTDFKRYVKSGEKGIRIIAPSSYIKRVTTEARDPVTNKAKLDGIGLPVMETKEIRVPTFRATTVFDISQTDGEPLPTIVNQLDSSVKDYKTFIEAVKMASPAEISFEDIGTKSDGFYDHAANKITIRNDMSEAQTVCACIHEIAHSKLHSRMMDGIDNSMKYYAGTIGNVPMLFSGSRIDDDKVPKGMYKYELRNVDGKNVDLTLETNVGVNHAGTVITPKPMPVAGDDYLELKGDYDFSLNGKEMTLEEFALDNQKNRNIEEIEAESISYAVCAYYGIDTKDNSFGYIATWSEDKELNELKESLSTINKTSSDIIRDIDRSLEELERAKENEKVAESEEKGQAKGVEPDAKKGGRERFSVVSKLHEYRDEEKKSGKGRSKSEEKIGGKEEMTNDAELEF